MAGRADEYGYSHEPPWDLQTPEGHRLFEAHERYVQNLAPRNTFERERFLAWAAIDDEVARRVAVTTARADVEDRIRADRASSRYDRDREAERERRRREPPQRSRRASRFRTFADRDAPAR